MVDDKIILYNMIDREIDNLMGFNSFISALSPIAKRYVHNYLDPYIDYFMDDNKSIQVDVATSFTKSEIEKKIEAFKKDFNEQKEGLKNEGQDNI